MEAGKAFLGVEHSLTGRRWRGPTAEEDRAAEALVQRAGVEPAVARVLARRGVPPEEAAGFLAPTLRDLMPDPRTLRDMDLAADRFVQAVDRRERIAIFADYDVDGGASAALLVHWLRGLGLGATLYVPDRIEEGYGPNEPAMSALAADHDLIVCVDCGTLSHGPIAAARGADVIVLDHHLGGETLPPALAVVNPNRQDESGVASELCAAGVVFLLLVEVNRRRREAGNDSPDLIALLDLVALATVADVAPLVGLNRAFVRQGLQVMARRQRPGLVALSDRARLDVAPAAYHLGFVLGPRINAGGRIGAADLGARLLSTSDPHEAAAIADRLEALNEERREVEAAVRDLALQQVAEKDAGQTLTWAAGDGWHPGVVGIVASRVKDAMGRPSVVIGFDGDDGKGSGRSIAGVDLGAAVQRLAAEGLIQRGGGHAMAAGVSLSRDQLEPAMERLNALLSKQAPDLSAAADLRLDGLLMPGAATADLIAEIDRAGPFGAAAPAPRFGFPDLAVGHADTVGEGHLRLTLTDGTARIEAIAFNAFSSDLGPALAKSGGARFHIAGRLELNHWRGRVRVQLRVSDAARA